MKNLAQATINLMLSMGWCMDLVYTAAVIFLANLGLSDDYAQVLYWYVALYKATVHMGHCDFLSPTEYASLCKENPISMLRAIRHFKQVCAFRWDLHCTVGRPVLM